MPVPRAHRKNPAPRRTPAEAEVDRQQIAHLMRRGMTKGLIADALGMSVGVVVREWEVVLRELRETRTEETRAAVDLKLQEYAELKAEAWEAWERSKEDAKRVTRKSGEGLRGPYDEEATVTEGRSGDAVYLRVVLDCLTAERDLLALNPVKEMKVTSTAQVNWDVFVGGVPDAVPDAVEDEIRRALDRSGAATTGLPCALRDMEAMPTAEQPPPLDNGGVQE